MGASGVRTKGPHSRSSPESDQRRHAIPIGPAEQSLTVQLVAQCGEDEGVAGGDGRYEVIRGAVRGRLVDVLITDEITATRLLQEKVPDLLVTS